MDDPLSDLVLAHRHSSCHADELTRSTVAGCFHCCEVFEPAAIESWIRDTCGKTAICPRCGIDAVIGSASGFPLTPDFLRRMRARWFGAAQ